jgi:transcription elongation factor S-II
MNVTNEDVFRSSIVKEVKRLGIPHPIDVENAFYEFTLTEAEAKNVFTQWNNPMFVQIYVDKFRSFFLNIRNNPVFLESILENKINIKDAVFMTHQEINPQRWKLLIDKKVAKDKCMYETKQESSTDTFTCGKCHSNRCSYLLIQTRSADEPMTTFVTCLNCDNRWKC